MFIVPTLDLVIAMNAGNYRKSGQEQRRIANVVLIEVVLAGIGKTLVAGWALGPQSRGSHFLQ